MIAHHICQAGEEGEGKKDSCMKGPYEVGNYIRRRLVFFLNFFYVPGQYSFPFLEKGKVK